jgi:hypothetical protein
MNNWTMNYIEELEARIKSLEKRNIENAAKLGEAIGALKGILHNEISEELKEKVNALLIMHSDNFSKE